MSESSLLGRHPPEDLLFDHLEQALCINGINVHVSLQSTVLNGPRNWLSNNAIGPELGQAFIYGIKYRLVEYVLALLLQRRGLESKGRFRWLSSCVVLYLGSSVTLSDLIFELSLFLYVKVHVDRQYRMLQGINARLKMIVLSRFLGLQLVQLVYQFFFDRLSQIMQENFQVVDSSHLLK